MTLVHFHLADAEGRGLDGSVSLVPTRRVTVLTRVCGFNDRSLVTLLQNAGLPPVFAATDHPY